MVPLLLIPLNYSAIEDFYKYPVPLNSLELSGDFQDTLEQFEKTKHLENHITREYHDMIQHILNHDFGI